MNNSLDILKNVYVKSKELKRFTLSQLSIELYGYRNGNLIRFLNTLIKLNILVEDKKKYHRIYYNFIQK